MPVLCSARSLIDRFLLPVTAIDLISRRRDTAGSVCQARSCSMHGRAGRVELNLLLDMPRPPSNQASTSTESVSLAANSSLIYIQ